MHKHNKHKCNWWCSHLEYAIKTLYKVISKVSLCVQGNYFECIHCFYNLLCFHIQQINIHLLLCFGFVKEFWNHILYEKNGLLSLIMVLINYMRMFRKIQMCVGWTQNVFRSSGNCVCALCVNTWQILIVQFKSAIFRHQMKKLFVLAFILELKVLKMARVQSMSEFFVVTLNAWRQ